MTGGPIPTGPQVEELVARLGEAIRQLHPTFTNMAAAGNQLSRVMTVHRRRWQLAAYRSGLVPWPAGRSCYPHRRRWAGRAPKRRRR